MLKIIKKIPLNKKKIMNSTNSIKLLNLFIFQ